LPNKHPRAKHKSRKRRRQPDAIGFAAAYAAYRFPQYERAAATATGGRGRARAGAGVILAKKHKHGVFRKTRGPFEKAQDEIQNHYADRRQPLPTSRNVNFSALWRIVEKRIRKRDDFIVDDRKDKHSLAIDRKTVRDAFMALRRHLYGSE
jgi:hypothetical protein